MENDRWDGQRRDKPPHAERRQAQARTLPPAASRQPGCRQGTRSSTPSALPAITTSQGEPLAAMLAAWQEGGGKAGGTPASRSEMPGSSGFARSSRSRSAAVQCNPH